MKLEIEAAKLDRYFLIFFGVTLSIISILNIVTGDYLFLPLNALFMVMALLAVRYDV